MRVFAQALGGVPAGQLGLSIGLASLRQVLAGIGFAPAGRAGIGVGLVSQRDGLLEVRGGHFAAAVLLGRVEVADAAGVVGPQVVGSQRQRLGYVFLHRAGFKGHGQEAGEFQAQALQQRQQRVVLGGFGRAFLQQLNALDERRLGAGPVFTRSEIQVVLRKGSPVAQVGIRFCGPVQACFLGQASIVRTNALVQQPGPAKGFAGPF